MKKLGIFVVFIISLFVSQSVFAAWTVSVTKGPSAEEKRIIKIELTGDGSALSQNIWSDIITRGVLTDKAVLGKYFYRYKTVPGTGDDAPSGTYTITIVDGFGDVGTLTGRSTTATEFGLISDVTSSGGFLISYRYLLITCEDIGDGNKTTLYLELVD